MKMLNVVLMSSFLLLTGCATSSRTVPFLAEQSYTTLNRYDGSPMLSVMGASNGWGIYSSNLKNNAVNATLPTYDGSGNMVGSMGIRIGVDYIRELNSFLANIRHTYFYYDLLVNQNYEQQAAFIEMTEHHRDAPIQMAIVEPVEFRGLHCIAKLTSQASTPRMGGYMLDKNINCPIVVDNRLGNFGFTLTISNWHAKLDDLKVHYGDDYLRFAFDNLETMLQPVLSSLEFHVGFSQNPDEMMDYGFPPLPEGMTYTGFYLEVIPAQFKNLSLPFITPRARVLTQEDVIKIKSTGLTLPMARQWQDFFERTRDAKEAQLREPGSLTRTEEGVQMRLKDGPYESMARLFQEVIERWDGI